MDQILTLITTLKDEKSETLKKILDDKNNTTELGTELMEMCKSTSTSPSPFNIKLLQIGLQLMGHANISYNEKKCPTKCDSTRGKTLLMISCISAFSSFEKITELLKYNPNVNILDCYGKTAMDYAFEKEQLKTFKLLTDYNIKQLNDKLNVKLKENEELSTKLKENEELTTKLKEELKINNDNLNKFNQIKENKEIKKLKEDMYEKCIEFLTFKFFGEDDNNVQNIILKEIEKGNNNYRLEIDNATKYLITQKYNLNLIDTLDRFFTNIYNANKLDVSVSSLLHIDARNCAIKFSF